jgi:uncharacterized membrane protein
MKVSLKRRIAGRHTWDQMSVNFLFIPGIMAVCAALLALLMYWLDGQIPNEMLNTYSFVVSSTVDESRGYLLNMGTVILTTAGVVFTLLTLPLSTVAAQYGSRLLRIFLGDRTTQFVLGIFVATFTYSVIGAIIIPSAEINPEAPNITVTVGLYLLIASFASLILLIQHISTMLQAPNIAAAAGVELHEVVSEENRTEVGGGGYIRQTETDLPDSIMERDPHLVVMNKTGYIKYIDLKSILPLAEKNDIVIRIVNKPGNFVRSGMVIARVWPADRMDAELDQDIRNTFHLGRQRTPSQDAEYAVNQLTEMAVRAMSPAINDPFTAMTCLDYIGNGLSLFVRQGPITPNIYDRSGQLRLVFDPVTFDELLNAAFDMLRHASSDNASVLLHMLKTIEVISQDTKSPDARQSLLRHVTLIQQESKVGSLIEEDRLSVYNNGEALKLKLKGGSST